jgi:predicted AAA+ superfamily ATPase
VPADYIPRLVDAEISRRLGFTGALVLEGARACGKTRTARHHAQSEVLLDTDANARMLAEVDPALLLRGGRPRLLDEWQTVPALWNHVRRAVDDEAVPGMFLLTGSAVPADDVTRHTGAGRIGRVRMWPLSLVETGAAAPVVSLGAMLEGATARGTAPAVPLTSLLEEVCRGGWPALQGLPASDALQRMRDYVDEVCRQDLQRLDGVKRDPRRVRAFVRNYSRHIASPAALRKIAAVPDDEAGDALHVDSARGYLAALERLMLVEEIPPWQTHLRSRSRQLQSSKRQWVDPSLAVAALGGSVDRLLRDLPFAGLLFESLVLRDLRTYAQCSDATLAWYRDNTGLEADVIVERADGAWGAIEIKLGEGEVDRAAEQLLRFRDRVDTRRCGPPSFLMVLVGMSTWAFTRPDGVSVVPLLGLGP